MIDAGAASLAVVYSDGNREINVGTVVVEPSLNFKSLLSLLSQMIGISPHQFSVYLAAVDTDRKIPITAKVNLAAVRREATAHYFFVKRSKRAKRTSANAKKPPEKVMLLRRAATGDPPFNTTFLPPILGRADYEQRSMNFQMERDSFRVNMSAAINGLVVGRESPNTVPASAAICEDCLKANTDGIIAAFHLCVFDTVTVGFRSSAGPISRPAKNSNEDGA